VCERASERERKRLRDSQTDREANGERERGTEEVCGYKFVLPQIPLEVFRFKHQSETAKMMRKPYK